VSPLPFWSPFNILKEEICCFAVSILPPSLIAAQLIWSELTPKWRDPNLCDLFTPNNKDRQTAQTKQPGLHYFAIVTLIQTCGTMPEMGDSVRQQQKNIPQFHRPL
jgi:hypothetical protein